MSGTWSEDEYWWVTLLLKREREREIVFCILTLLFLIASIKNVKSSMHSLLVMLESLHAIIWVVSMRTCLISLFSLKLFYLLLLGKHYYVDAYLLIS